jgi:hypothetical protein
MSFSSDFKLPFNEFLKYFNNLDYRHNGGLILGPNRKDCASKAGGA